MTLLHAMINVMYGMMLYGPQLMMILCGVLLMFGIPIKDKDHTTPSRIAYHPMAGAALASVALIALTVSILLRLQS